MGGILYDDLYTHKHISITKKPHNHLRLNYIEHTEHIIYLQFLLKKYNEKSLNSRRLI